MNFEEPRVEFISMSNTDVVFASPGGCYCVDGSAGSTESCVGNNSFSDGGCTDSAQLIS
ncbi:MAG: hypothetical protein Q4B18_07775 [Bacillota bacterium]|nr:hypothetical protein [Bacillota bacterium]